MERSCWSRASRWAAPRGPPLRTAPPPADTGPLGEDADQDGYGAGDDCADGRADVHPGAEEACDGADQDCDGAVDEGVLLTWYADADEVCDGQDDDCDGLADDDDPDTLDRTTWYADADADGYGDPAEVVYGCTPPSGYIADGGDCDDADPTVPPAAFEPCSGPDMDCDGIEPDLCGSCAAALDDGYTTDGLYEVDIGGLGGSEEVWCDMTTDGGGWTLVQRSVWDWAESYLLWTTYKEWTGDPEGDPDEGRAFRLPGELWPELNADGDVLAVMVARDGGDGSDCDPLRYEGTGATLTVDTSAATILGLVSTVSLTNNTTLSATDTGPYTSCVLVPNYGVPWFYGGCCSTCPTFKGSAWTDEPHPMANYLDVTADLDGLTVADTCPSGAAVHSYYGIGTYEGVNVMEFYLR